MSKVMLGNFDLLYQQKLAFTPGFFEVSKYKSRKSGLTVYWLNANAPIVRSYFVFPTEANDSSGCAHTLEHLCFLGSKTYPYKGILDTLANYTFASGTNAWTDTDETVYTIETAGSEGLLRFLPIYAEHLFFPTLTEQGFVTEVYHINGKGQDGGVVYAEMQSAQGEAASIMETEFSKLVYPASSGYAHDTGGYTEQLRILKLKQIQEFHKKFYTPQNAALIIAGPLNEEDFFKMLNDNIEPILADCLPVPDFKRPFMETPSAEPLQIAQNLEHTAYFPSEDETTGEINMHWVGPLPKEVLKYKAIEFLLSYLTSTAASPLQQYLVEIAEPYCVDISAYAMRRANASRVCIGLQSVPVQHLPQLTGLVQELLHTEINKGLDMSRLRNLVQKDLQDRLDSIDVYGPDAYCHTILAGGFP